MNRFSWVGIGVLAGCTATTDVVEQASAVRGLAGTIEIDGCTPVASDIHLTVARAKVSRHDQAVPDDDGDDNHALGLRRDLPAERVPVVR